MSIQNLVFDDSTQLTNKLMEMSLERQKVIANNIANADTPGYIRKELDFESKLADAVKAGDLDQIRNVEASLEKDTATPTNLDGNNVTVPTELNNMMQNSIYYNLLARAFSTKMSILKNSISSQ